MSVYVCVCVCVCVPGFDEESVLDEDGDDKEDHALHSHCKQVFPHHVPLQRRAEPDLT